MNVDLKNQKCQACSGNTPVFNDIQISENLAKLDNWSVNDEQKMIFKKFKFKTFKQALNFTNKVGELADIEGHTSRCFTWMGLFINYVAHSRY